MDTLQSNKPTSLYYFGLSNEPERKFFWYVFNKPTGTYWKFGKEETNIKNSYTIIDKVKSDRENNSEKYYYLVIHKKDLIFWLGDNDDSYSYKKIKAYHKKQFNWQYISENFDYVKDEWGKTRSCIGGFLGFIVLVGSYLGGIGLIGYFSIHYGFIGFLVSGFIVLAILSVFSRR